MPKLMPMMTADVTAQTMNTIHGQVRPLWPRSTSSAVEPELSGDASSAADPSSLVVSTDAALGEFEEPEALAELGELEALEEPLGLEALGALVELGELEALGEPSELEELEALGALLDTSSAYACSKTLPIIKLHANAQSRAMQLMAMRLPRTTSMLRPLFVYEIERAAVFVVIHGSSPVVSCIDHAVLVLVHIDLDADYVIFRFGLLRQIDVVVRDERYNHAEQEHKHAVCDIDNVFGGVDVFLNLRRACKRNPKPALNHAARLQSLP